MGILIITAEFKTIINIRHQSSIRWQLQLSDGWKIINGAEWGEAHSLEPKENQTNLNAMANWELSFRNLTSVPRLAISIENPGQLPARGCIPLPMVSLAKIQLATTIPSAVPWTRTPWWLHSFLKSSSSLLLKMGSQYKDTMEEESEGIKNSDSNYNQLVKPRLPSVIHETTELEKVESGQKFSYNKSVAPVFAGGISMTHRDSNDNSQFKMHQTYSTVRVSGPSIEIVVECFKQIPEGLFFE